MDTKRGIKNILKTLYKSIRCMLMYKSSINKKHFKKKEINIMKQLRTAKENGIKVIDEFGTDISSRVRVHKVPNGKLAIYDEFEICITKRVKIV